MPELKRRTPCADCPFRKTSARGWLGAATAQEFLDSTMHDAEMPCHTAIDYGDKEWKETQLPTADLCVGSLQFLNNQHKLPRSRKLSDACREVGQNDAIMDSPEQFMERHDNDLNRRYVETARKPAPTKMTTDLPESMKLLPVHIRMKLPVPVVNTFGFNEIDYTAVNGTMSIHLAQRKLCGICGQRFHNAAFLGGPRSAQHRAYSDPPMHEECALAAIRLCPHIARKNMRRATDNHARQDAITPEYMTLDKPDEWKMVVCQEYKIYVDGAEDERTPRYAPQDVVYIRTWRYTPEGTLEEVE